MWIILSVVEESSEDQNIMTLNPAITT